MEMSERGPVFPGPPALIRLSRLLPHPLLAKRYSLSLYFQFQNNPARLLPGGCRYVAPGSWPNVRRSPAASPTASVSTSSSSGVPSPLPPLNSPLSVSFVCWPPSWSEPCGFSSSSDQLTGQSAASSSQFPLGIVSGGRTPRRRG